MSNTIINRVVGGKPATQRQVSAAWKAFQRLWVAGTLGAMFTALAKTIPVHMKQLGSPIDWYYTFDIGLRYAYFIWLIAYFFTSNLRTQSSEPPDRGDVLYDVVQSAFALAAAFFLDFLVTDGHHKISALIGANTAIFVICSLAWILFREDDTPNIQKLRKIGAVSSFISILVASGGPVFKSQSLRSLGTLGTPWPAHPSFLGFGNLHNWSRENNAGPK